MNAVELLETITHLISQAEKGEIDPWDVRVIEVIDHYLELMSPEASTTRGYETDLSQSGQAFLSASMLVLFKANTLMLSSTVDDTQEEVIDDTILGFEDGLLYPAHRLQLERHLRRRPAAMPPPKRRVTLQELIDQLQIMANQLKLVEKVNQPKRIKRQSSVQTMRETLELAHQENLTEVALELEQVLHLAAKGQNLEEQCWNLEELIDLWIQTKQPEKSGEHHESEYGNLVSVFWALLLLSAQSKVELFQKEFYQEIQIRLPT
ncbi:segregation/condensation protein A [Anabaena sp. UHCC 0204]|uniref:segregation/condensation protein A n=1 Tax=Anabaena sp. UHCC 0204 TaxID=2590009 RepID=UPI001445F6B6|nr:ScpA family protein [Anabaena sp. UHCC 0204]MTJ09218.1 segregation/condensation protein A [Anabaena sp. UHCC 0204]